jgi:hypothetical protein
MTLTISIDQEYIETIGSNFTDRSGNCEYNKAQSFVSRIKEVAFTNNAYSEMRSGWRNRVSMDVDETHATDFVDCCTDQLSMNSLTISESIQLLQPLQIESGKQYKQDHIVALKDAPIKYRKKQAEYLSPLLEVCSNVLSLEDILSLLLDGIFDNVKPLGTDNRLRTISETLEAYIEQHSDDIDLDDEYFYQGPSRLGILQTGKCKQIARCVCVKNHKNGDTVPLFLSDEDPVNSEAKEILEYVEWSN